MEIQENVSVSLAENLNVTDICNTDSITEQNISVFNANLSYLCDVFVKACISALQSDIYGPWIHLIEIVNIIKPFAGTLISRKNVLRYACKVHQFCNVNGEINKLNVVQLFEDTFPFVNFSKSYSSTINTDISQTINRSSSVVNILKPSGVSVCKDVYYPGNVDNLFYVASNELNYRMYQPATMNVNDLERYLPHVASEVSKLECTWGNALGLTLTSLSTDIPRLITKGQVEEIFHSTNPDLNKKKEKKINAYKRCIPKTGREVVETLVCSTRKSELKIWYLNFVPSRFYDPYNLVVTDKATIQKEHVVISLFGVLYVRSNGMSELVSVGQWYSEAVCFDTIRNIRLFRYHKELKSFRKWQFMIHQLRFQKLQRNLEKLLLYKVPSFPGCVIKVREILEQLQSVSFFPHFQNSHICINSLESLMQSAVLENRKYLNKTFLFCWEVIRDSYTECLDYFEYCELQLEENNTSSKESLAVAKKKLKIQIENYKSSKEILNSFDKFLKLINFMIFSELVSIISAQLQSFIQDQVMQNGVGLFRISVLISENQTAFLEPSTETIFESMFTILHSVLQELQAFIIISINSNIIKTESDVTTSEESNVKEHLVNKTLRTCTKKQMKLLDMCEFIDKGLFTKLKDSIFSKASSMYSLERLKYELEITASKEANEYFKSLEWLQRIGIFLQQYNTNEVEDWNLKSADEIEKHLTAMKSQCDRIRNMQISFVTSNDLLFIDSSEVKDKFLPRVEVIIQSQIKVLLRNILDQAKKYIKELTNLLKILSKTNLEIEDFANYFVILNKIKKDTFSYQENVERIRSVFDVVRQSFCSLSQEEEETDEELRVIWMKFVYTLQTGQDFINTHAPSLTTTLNREIKKMIECALMIAELATTGKFLDQSQDAKTILKELGTNYEEFNHYEQKIRVYSECRKLINGEEMNFEKLNYAQTQITTRYEIWKYLERTIHTINQWKQTSLSKLCVNLTKVIEKVNEWKHAYKVLKVNVVRPDSVLLKWKEMLTDFEKDLDVLRELAHPSLKALHWTDIFIILGHTYNTSYPYKVSDIFDMAVHENYDKIHAVCLSAISQAAIGECLRRLIRDWEKKEFKFSKNIDFTQKTRLQKNKSDAGYTLASLDELSSLVEDSLITLQSMLVSPYVAGIRHDTLFWSHHLQELKECINSIAVVQQQWKYITNIFKSKRMQDTNSTEYQRFLEVNATFKEIISSLLSDPKVLNILEKRKKDINWRELQGTKLKEILNEIFKKMSIIIMQLQDYLIKIRDSFPRLYFLSNDEMLELLAISRNPRLLEPFIRKCFPGVESVKLEIPQNSKTKLFTQFDVDLNAHLLEAVSISGCLNEKLALDEQIEFNISVERFFKKFDCILKKSVWNNIFNCVKELTMLYTDNSICMNAQAIQERLLHHQFTGQSLFLIHDWLWNGLYVKALKKEITMKHCIASFNEIIGQLTDCIKMPQIWSLSNSPADRRFLLLFQSFLLQAIYYRDKLMVVQHNPDSSFELFTNIQVKIVEESSKFELQQRDFNVELNCCNSTLAYGFEYHSPKESLCITPLTERCMLTLFLSINDFQIGCVVGDKTNGKYETILMTSQKLGRHLVNINCTPDISLFCIQQFLHGCLTSGSLACFRNIHLLPLNLLSAVGHHFYEIRNAIKILTTKEKLTQSDRCHSVAETIDITNPAEKNNTANKTDPFIQPSIGLILLNNRLVEVNSLYGSVVIHKGNISSWKEVPDNLRESFRPVSFHCASVIKIYEAWLLLCGFLKCKEIAMKLHALVKACEQEINVNAVSLKKMKSLILQSAKDIHFNKKKNDEEVYIVSTLIQFLKPSVKQENMKSLIQNMYLIFPSCKGCIQYSLSYDALLTESIKEQAHADNLLLKQEFLDKILILAHILSTSQSVILVGSAATGKTTCYTTLCRALCQFYSPWSQRKDMTNRSKDGGFARTNLNVIFPNMMNPGDLFGKFDESKGIWVDGLLTKLLNNTNKQEQSKLKIQQWFILDGALQESWVVPFETLLDFSKQYTLSSSKSVQISDDTKLLFETDNLQCVSPSLIASSSIMYFAEDDAVDWKSILTCWKQVVRSKYSLLSSELGVIDKVLEYVFDQIVSFINNECENNFTADIPCEERKPWCSSVIACDFVLQTLSCLFNLWKSRNQSKDVCASETKNRSVDEQDKYISHMLAWSIGNSLVVFVHERSLLKLDTFIRQLFVTCPVTPIIFPASILDCYFDGKVGELVAWNQSKFEKHLSPTSTSFVFTKDLQKLYYKSHMLLAAEKNILYVGPTASGKSSFVKFLSTKHTVTKFQMSKAMSVEELQEKIFSRSRSVLNAKKYLTMEKTERNEQLLFFIDDVNESSSTNGEIENLECLRQFTSTGGMYNMNKKVYEYLPHTNFILAYKTPGCDRLGADHNLPLNERFYRHFNLLRLYSYCDDEKVSIFTKLCENWFTASTWFPCSHLFAEILSNTTIKLHNVLDEELRSKSLHYSFNFHDISRVVKGLLCFKLDAQKDIMACFKEYFCRNQSFVQTSISGLLERSETLDNTTHIVTTTLQCFIQLYFHEIKSTYNERITYEDLDSLQIEQLIVDKIQSEVEKRLQHSLVIRDGEAQLFLNVIKNIIESIDAKHTHFIKSPLEDKLLSTYQQVLQKDFEKLLQNVNEEKLILFDEMVIHCASLARILNFHGSHSLLISKGGHGRKEATKLIAKLYSFDWYEVSYSMRFTDQKVSIKDACYSAGLNGAPTILHISEDVSYEILNLISALINDGYCPGLYTSTELSHISTQFLPGNNRTRKFENSATLHNRFYQSVKRNLHIILCVNFDDLNRILNRYHVFLYKMTLVDMYEEWSGSVLKRIAKELLNRNKRATFKNHTDETCTVLSKFHVTTNVFLKNNEKYQKLTTPLKYIEFVDLSQRICNLISYEKTIELKHYEKAVFRITETQDEIKRFASELGQLTPKVQEAKQILQAAELEMKTTQLKYTDLKQMRSQQNEHIKELQQSCTHLSKRTQEDFEQLSPIYDAVVNALELVNQHTVEELRSYRAPPQGIIDISHMLCIMFDVPPCWEEAKLLLMRDKFVEELIFYDKDKISKKIYSSLSKFIQTPLGDLKYIVTLSLAAYQLAVWMHAIHSYCVIFRQLEPMKNQFLQAKNNLEAAEKKLVDLKLQCSELKNDLGHKIEVYKMKGEDLHNLETQEQFLLNSKKNAITLLQSMELFSNQWLQSISSIQTYLSVLTYISALVAARVVYFGIISHKQQEKLLEEWKAFLPVTVKTLTLSELLSDMLSLSDEHVDWQKITNDANLICNMLCVRCVTFLVKRCWPLIIDAHNNSETVVRMIEGVKKTVMKYEQPQQWTTKVVEMKEREKPKNQNKPTEKSLLETDFGGLVIIQADDPKLDEVLKSSMDKGNPLLVKNIERITDSDVLFQAVADRSRLNLVGDKYQLRAGSNIIEVHHNFRLYLSADISLQSLTKEKSSLPIHQMILVNMEMEKTSLYQQIHNMIILKERPGSDVPVQRMKLDLHYFQDEKSYLHTTVLDSTADIPIPLLKRKNVVDYMAFHQEKLMLETEKYIHAEVNLKEFLKELDRYKPLSDFICLVYFLIQDICKIHPLYTFSLNEFISVLEKTFKENVTTKSVSVNVHSRIEQLQKNFTRRIFLRFSNVLFSEHVLLFPLCLVLENARVHLGVSDKELELFVLTLNDSEQPVFEDKEGNIGCTADDVTGKPDWINLESWRRFILLSKMVPAFKTLLRSLIEKSDIWVEYFKLPLMLMNPYCHTEYLHRYYLGLLWLAYDVKLFPSICESVILCQFGPEFINIPSLYFPDVLNSLNQTSINIIVLPDDNQPIVQDPVDFLSNMCKQNKASGINIISLTNENEMKHAINTLKEASKNGFWIVFNNCHLVESWSQEFINTLMNILDALSVVSEHDVKGENLAQKAKTSISKHFRVFMILRSETKCLLPNCVLRKSNTIAWQISKYDKKTLMITIQESIQDIVEKEEVKLSASQTYLHEVMKDRYSWYKNTLKLSSCDKSFIARLSVAMSTFYQGLNERAKDIAISPQLTNQLDHLIFQKNYDTEAVSSCPNERNVIQRNNLADIYSNAPRFHPTCKIDMVQHIYAIFQQLNKNHSLQKPIALTQQYVSCCIQNELLLLYRSLNFFSTDLELLVKAMQGLTPYTSRLECVLNGIAYNVVPKPWCCIFIQKTVTFSKEMTWSIFVEALQLKISYFNSLLYSSHLIPSIKLNNFYDPKSFVTAVKYQHAVDFHIGVMDVEWIGQVWYELLPTPKNTTLKNGIYFEDMKLYTHLKKGSYNGQKGKPVIISLIHFKPRKSKNLHTNTETVPVYAHALDDDVLFNIESINPSEDKLEAYFYLS